MKFYTETHQYFCGIDLHTKTMYLCILDPSGEVVLHTNIPAKPQPFLKAIKPFREELSLIRAFLNSFLTSNTKFSCICRQPAGAVTKEGRGQTSATTPRYMATLSTG